MRAPRRARSAASRFLFRAEARAQYLSRMPAPAQRMSGAMRRCPQPLVRAKRSTLRA